MFPHNNRQTFAFVSLSFALLIVLQCGEYAHGRSLLYTTSSLSNYGKSYMTGGFNDDAKTSIVPLAEDYGLHKNPSLNVSGNTDECDGGGCNNYVETTMVPPAESYGYFRDPLEILGSRFPRSRTTNLCENHVLMGADNTVHDVRFTRRGARVCAEMCSQYRDNMMKNQADVDVHSWPGYCDFMGATESQQTGSHDLRTACTCAYKVRCDRRTELMLYSFESDSGGNLRVTVTESDRKHYVTAYLLSIYLQD